MGNTEKQGKDRESSFDLTPAPKFDELKSLRFFTNFIP